MAYVVVPMRAESEAIAQRRAAVDSWIRSTELRLVELRACDPNAREYVLPLPWYAHENSWELDLIFAYFKPAWECLRLRRSWECLKLVFEK